MPICHKLATDQNGPDRTIEGFCGFWKTGFASKIVRNFCNIAKKLDSKSLIYLLERATRVELATFSLGSYITVFIINGLGTICHILATSNRQYC
jgi:hypothetical protein